jgi:hypothetical protein
MKSKILALGFLSLCSMAMFAGESQAWLFQCFHHHKYTTQITCRPYNAFTPICWGNLVCDGCCPSFGGGGGCQMPMMMGAPFACGYGGYGACGANGCGGAPAATPPVTNFTPPMPMPAGTTFYPPSMQMPMPTAPNAYYPSPDVSQANYYPQGYYPQAYYPAMPTYYSPYAGYYPAPNYWYGR